MHQSTADAETLADLDRWDRKECPDAEEASQPQPQPGQPKVFLGVPHTHGVEWETAKAVLARCSEPTAAGPLRCHLKVKDHPSSLLANGFNQLLAECVNDPHVRWDYFLLVHSDIAVLTDWFVDVLVEDAEAGGFDVLHVPQPIKDGRDLTSTALMNRKDKWARPRRLTVKELLRLPDLFDEADALRVMTGLQPRNPCLAPNTGMMLLKMGPWVADFCDGAGFHMEDKMMLMTVDRGTPRERQLAVPRVVPEDWNFGWWCANHGVKVGGSRRVKTRHLRMPAGLPNYEALAEGEETDHLFVVTGGRYGEQE